MTTMPDYVRSEIESLISSSIVYDDESQFARFLEACIACYDKALAQPGSMMQTNLKYREKDFFISVGLKP